MNGVNETTIDLRNVTLGRITRVGIVKVDFRLGWGPRSATTINHEEITGYWRLGVSASLWKRVDSDDCFEAGQIRGRLRELRTPLAADIAKVWKRWHLNDMHAECAHQTGKDAPPCEVTGYRWGSAWLVEEIPADQVDYIRRIAARIEALASTA